MAPSWVGVRAARSAFRLSSNVANCGQGQLARVPGPGVCPVMLDSCGVPRPASGWLKRMSQRERPG